MRLPQGSRAIVCYASANRDERKWGDPTDFRIMREDSADHLGFGHGEHNCVGKNSARLKIRALLTALASRVDRFELSRNAEYFLNNCLRGIKTCPVTVHRGRRMPRVTYVAADSTEVTIDGRNGTRVMETGIRNAVAGIIAECGGSCMCATCHLLTALGQDVEITVKLPASGTARCP